MSTDTGLSDLPPEVVFHILSYVPIRHNAALVCKKFYEHICAIEKDYYKLTLNSKIHVNDENQKYINDLLASKRQITEITLSGTAGSVNEKLDSIFDKFGGLVTKANVQGCNVKENQLGRWINTMPLLEELNFEKSTIEISDTDSTTMTSLSRNLKLSLKEFQFGENTSFIKAIPTGVVQSLAWNSLPKRTKTTSLKFNKGLKSEPDYFFQYFLSQANATGISFGKELQSILSRQSNITSLLLRNVPLTIDLFNIICKIKSLEQLEFVAESLPATALVDIEQLTKLKSLVANDGNKEHLQAITMLNLPGLEVLGLMMFPELDYCWNKMKDRFKGIKKIQAVPGYSLKSIETMIRGFSELEVIKLGLADGVTFQHYKPDRNLDFTKLKHFLVGVGPIVPSSVDATPIINICTNLEVITLYISQDISFLKHLIQTKKRLRKLSILMNGRASHDPTLSSTIVSLLGADDLQLRAMNLIFVHKERNWNIALDMNFIRSRLIERFPIIVKDFFYGSPNLTVKKRGESFEFLR